MTIRTSIDVFIEGTCKNQSSTSSKILLYFILLSSATKKLVKKFTVFGCKEIIKKNCPLKLAEVITMVIAAQTVAYTVTTYCVFIYGLP